MKKIAILTQPLRINYGGIIQNYALQKVLKNFGFEPTTIDRHRSIKLRHKLRLGYLRRLVLSFMKNDPQPVLKHYFLTQADQDYLFNEIHKFIDKYINKTPRLYSDDEVRMAFEKESFDAVIVGSDQVWRPKYSPNIYSYFLDFLQHEHKIKKLTYAASFGTEAWEYSPKQTIKCRQLIQQFDAISVREKAAIGLVDSHFQKQTTFALDPTLLLTQDDYKQLYSSKELNTNKGIYTYILDQADWKTQVVEQVKQVLGKEQFNNQPRANLFRSTSTNLDDYKIPSIEGWLKGYADADFVITDSFHGMVFSLIFNKPFIALINKNRGASRFYSLLSELNLSDRLLSEYDEQVVGKLMQNNINFEEVRQKIEELKERSVNYLLGTISSNNE